MQANDLVADMRTNAHDAEGSARELESQLRAVSPLGKREGMRRLWSDDDQLFDIDRDELLPGIVDIAGKAQNVVTVSKELERRISSYGDEIERLGRLALEAIINEMLARHRPIICIFAQPFFDLDIIADGFLRRVKDIDGLLPSSFLRVYCYRTEEVEQTTLDRIDDDHVLIRYRDPSQESIVDTAVGSSACVYSHSIYWYEEEILARHPQVPYILDYHGVVPEEKTLMGADDEVVRKLCETEKSAVARANGIVCVSEAMEDHIRIKYPEQVQETSFFFLPILPFNSVRTHTTPGGKPIVIYAGGTQKWQLFDEMIQALRDNLSSYDYELCVPNPEKVREDWKIPSSVAVVSRTHDELAEEYKRASFGFALRNKSVVNKVACPTKLSEYVMCGVVPILKTTCIGDFASMGMAYLDFEAFKRGYLPDDQEREKMVEANYIVAKKLIGRFDRGLAAFGAQLRAYADDKRAA